MHLPDKIEQYIAELCKQVRFGRVHPFVAEEMKAHLIDGRDAYIAEGFDVETATEKSITDAGDAVLLGAEFDRVHRPKAQWAMFLWVAGFLLLGLLVNIVLFGNMPTLGQLMSIAVGLALMLGMYYLDFTIFAKYPRLMSAALLLFWMLVSSAYPFLHLFSLLFAVEIFRAKGRGYKGLFICCTIYGAACLGLLFRGWTNVYLHFALVGALLLIIANVRNWFGVSKGLSVLLSVLFFTFIHVVSIFGLFHYSYFFRIRFLAAFNPQIDPLGFGWLPQQIRETLSGASLFGAGTQGEVALWLLPAPGGFQQELLFTALIARFGWVSLVLILAALLAFIIKATKGSLRQKSELGFFVSIAVVLTFSAQVLSYVAYNLGFLLVQLSLPFLTLGSAAMIANLGLIGVMLSVFRTGDMPNALKERPSNAMKN